MSDSPIELHEGGGKIRRVWELTAAGIGFLSGSAAVGLSTSFDSIPLLVAVSAGTIACLTLLGLLLLPVRLAPVALTPETKSSTDPLANRPWVGLVEEVVDLLDELKSHRPRFDAGTVELADHIELRLQEALERSGVTVVEDDETFDPARHTILDGPTPVPMGARIIDTVHPALTVGRRVLRRAVVRVGPADCAASPKSVAGDFTGDCP